MSVSILQWSATVWFGLSIVALVFSRFFLWRWLANRGAHVEWLFVGTPGYLESVYRRLCITTGRSPRSGLFWNGFLYASAIGATIVFFFTVAAPQMATHK